MSPFWLSNFHVTRIIIAQLVVGEIAAVYTLETINNSVNVSFIFTKILQEN